jgi:lipopolysaccharide/colanic/teichoic acid biosynthesis glycosyltransferase
MEANRMHERIQPALDRAAQVQRGTSLTRVADVATALLLIMVLMPIFVGVALASYRPNVPLILRRQRLAPHGRRLTVFEFNAGDDADSAGIRRDGIERRLAPYLRMFRGHQLPQLFNVVRGELSFFGDASSPRLFAD